MQSHISPIDPINHGVLLFFYFTDHMHKSAKKFGWFEWNCYICKQKEIDMLVLQDCIQKLSDFKVAFAQKFGILKLGIFGSVARNENTEDSDIDIVVEVQKPSLQLMYELREALKQLFGCEVDLVRFRDSLRPLFKSNIQKDVIYV